MNERERAICARLKQFREQGGWMRKPFAEKLGITDDKLASVERGATPLRYDLAQWACARFNISQRWLAEGKGPSSYFIAVRHDLTEAVSPRALFSSVYFDILKPHLDREFYDLEQTVGPSPTHDELNDYKRTARPIAGGTISTDDFFWVAAKRIRQAAVGLPAVLLQDLMDNIGRSIREFEAKHGTILEKFRAAALRAQPEELRAEAHSGVDKLRKTVNCPSVTPTWEQTIELAKEATAEPGSKGKLAEVLGVPPSRLSEWLGGKYEPGAEVAFRLAAEVAKLMEAKSKSVASVRPLATPAAPMRTNNESPKPRPKRASHKGRKKHIPKAG